MKKILLAICTVFLFSTFCFAGDDGIFPNMAKPAIGGMDTYVLTDDSGSTEVINVIQIGKDMFVGVDSEGNSTHIMKIGD